MINELYFTSRFPFDKDREKVWEIITQYLQKEISPQAKILELGAGYCNFINNIQGAEKHALDMLDIINKYATKDVITHIKDSTKMDNFKTDYFDVIFASNFFEHLTKDEWENTFLEIKRILKRGGKLIIIQPNFKYAYKEYFDDYTHNLIFTHIGLSDFLKSHHFEILKLIPRFIPFSMKSKLPKFPLLVKLYLYSPIKPLGKQMLIIAKKRDNL